VCGDHRRRVGTAFAWQEGTLRATVWTSPVEFWAELQRQLGDSGRGLHGVGPRQRERQGGQEAGERRLKLGGGGRRASAAAHLRFAQRAEAERGGITPTEVGRWRPAGIGGGAPTFCPESGSREGWDVVRDIFRQLFEQLGIARSRDFFRLTVRASVTRRRLSGRLSDFL
jgi:hypothetical protein